VTSNPDFKIMILFNIKYIIKNIL